MCNFCRFFIISPFYSGCLMFLLLVFLLTDCGAQIPKCKKLNKNNKKKNLKDCCRTCITIHSEAIIYQRRECGSVTVSIRLSICPPAYFFDLFTHHTHTYIIIIYIAIQPVLDLNMFIKWMTKSQKQKSE